MLIVQISGLHHLIAHHLIAHHLIARRCLVSLETKFQFRDMFRHKMTAKILEHVIGELSDSETNYRMALLS